VIITRWIWSARSPGARMARLALLPPATLYRCVMALRARAYASQLLPTATPEVPTIAVGNLTVGGSGKTPLASWIAEYYVAKGLIPGIVLRGVGGDEGDVHRERVPQAVVVEDADRLAGARAAVARGATVVVLDDAFQRLNVGRDLNIAVVSAESSRAAPWTLPAGPWREGWTALRRADVVIVTRKRASRSAARRVAERVARTTHAPVAVARLAIVGFRGLLTGARYKHREVDGARLLVSAGIADPDAFAAQCRRLGGNVDLLAFPDHHGFDDRDLMRLRGAARNVDYVVVTEKDAVKLRRLWPETAAEPLVACLEVIWEFGRERVETALDAATADVDELVAGDSDSQRPRWQSP